MEQIRYCPKCNDEMKFVPAGISKQGNNYPAFWSCKQRNCGYTENLDGTPGRSPKKRENAPQVNFEVLEDNIRRSFAERDRKIKLLEERVKFLEGYNESVKGNEPYVPVKEDAVEAEGMDIKDIPF